jgi:hypothetical protein
MTNRGRQSAASLAVQTITSPIETVQRLSPPVRLSDEEVDIWVDVVESHPADWFDKASAHMLVQFCRHTIATRRIADLITQALETEPFNVHAYDELLKMQERETRTVLSVATKLRITPQSTTNHRGNKIQLTVKKPWEA